MQPIRMEGMLEIKLKQGGNKVRNKPEKIHRETFRNNRTDDGTNTKIKKKYEINDQLDTF